MSVDRCPGRNRCEISKAGAGGREGFGVRAGTCALIVDDAGRNRDVVLRMVSRAGEFE